VPLFGKKSSKNEDALLELARSFHNNKEEKVYVYLKNFGGIFAKRIKDGMTLGYLEKRNKIGKEDHATIFYNTTVGLSGLHRKIVDNKTTVYVHYMLEYVTRKNGLKRLLVDLLNDENTEGYVKAIVLFVFYEIRLFYGIGLKRVTLLSNTKAKRLGMKSPCIFIETGLVGTVQLVVFSKLLPVIRYYSVQSFGDSPSRGFKEQGFPGAVISKKNR